MLVCGVSLGIIWSMFRIRKIQRKTRTLMAENDKQFEEWKKLSADPNATEKEIIKASYDFSQKLERVAGRIEAVSEFFG